MSEHRFLDIFSYKRSEITKWGTRFYDCTFLKNVTEQTCSSDGKKSTKKWSKGQTWEVISVELTLNLNDNDEEIIINY